MRPCPAPCPLPTCFAPGLALPPPLPCRPLVTLSVLGKLVQQVPMAPLQKMQMQQNVSAQCVPLLLPHPPMP